MKNKRYAPVAPNYLAKPNAQWRSCTLVDLATMLMHVFKAAENEEVGWEDAHNTLDQITRKLNRRFYMDPSVLESALFCANLLDERGEFSHPQGLKFESWVKRFLRRGERFNRHYNYFEKIPKKGIGREDAGHIERSEKDPDGASPGGDGSGSGYPGPEGPDGQSG